MVGFGRGLGSGVLSGRAARPNPTSFLRGSEYPNSKVLSPKASGFLNSQAQGLEGQGLVALGFGGKAVRQQGASPTPQSQQSGLVPGLLLQAFT